METLHLASKCSTHDPGKVSKINNVDLRVFYLGNKSCTKQTNHKWAAIVTRPPDESRSARKWCMSCKKKSKIYHLVGFHNSQKKLFISIVYDPCFVSRSKKYESQNWVIFCFNFHIYIFPSHLYYCISN